MVESLFHYLKSSVPLSRACPTRQDCRGVLPPSPLVFTTPLSTAPHLGPLKPSLAGLEGNTPGTSAKGETVAGA